MTVARLPSAARNCSHAAHGPALSPTPAAAKRPASVRPPPATPSDCWSSATHPLYEPGLTSLDNLGVWFSALGCPRRPAARKKVQGLPAGFRYRDLRHYFASSASGADVKTVQARLRHTSVKTTLDTYGHIRPDRDESTRAAVDAVITARTEQRRNDDEAASH